ncbi:MAG: hypothetical protein ACW98D_19605 [Promethearchaeota archaeon]|jgi:hypothetical protein
MTEDKNYIRCRIILEMLGKPKEHIEKTLKGFVEKIKQDTSYMVIKEEFAEAKEQETMWSSFVELEMVFNDIKSLLPFCFDYMPSSIEVIKPENINVKQNDLSNFLNDLQGRLHHVDMIAKKLKAETVVLKKNLNTSLKNVILLVLGVKKISPLEELSKFTGIKKEELNPFLEQLVKEEKIKKEEQGYSLK